MVAPLPFARVALAIPVPQLFDYEVPRGLEEEVVPGARVRVPFGSGVRIGYCVERTGQARHSKPRSIEAVLDEAPLIEPGLLRLMRWAAEYYISSIGDVIESAIPRRVREGRVRRIRWVGLIEVDGPAQRGAGKEARERILGLLKERGAAIPIGELLATAAVGESPVKTLERQGRVEIFRAPSPGAGGPVARGTPRRTAVKSDPGFALTPEQERSVRRMVPAIRRPAFQAFLLHGVTGSGKTEVYLQSIHAALEEGRGALVLLPEISLTPQTVKRFRERVGEVAVLHSLLGAGERAHEYWRLRARKARVAIGARSAVFAPVPDLGLIVVDECHESSYKQESSPRYHARDVAVMRASQLGIPCLLGTATPSLESLENARRERYTLLRLPSRVTSQSLATIEIIDRRREIPGRNHRTGILSPRLADLVRETVARDEQVMLFLNRRGFARNIHCPRCGFALRCDECDIGLTYHRRKDRSQCHYCGGVHSLPRSCPDCSFPGMRRSRPGTERIEECLGRLLPGVPVARLDRDTATSSSRMEEILEGFRRGQTRVLVGTQMIAKGHDIPGVTLVGVVDADVALNLPDFRAAERTAQLLCQVAGRAGRGDRPGRVAIQTWQPEHYALEAARRQDLSALLEREAPARRLLGYPPFGFLARILCEDRDERRSLESARAIRELIDAQPCRGVTALGPAPAPLSRLRGRYRQHLLLKGKERPALHRAAERIAWIRPRWATTRVTVDIDPLSLL